MIRSLLWTSLGILLGAGGYALAQHAAGDGDGGLKQKILMEQVLPGKLDGKEVQMTVLELERGPGGASPAHRHPGPVFVYVLDGEMESQLDGQPLKTYRKGEMFYEPPGGVHRVSRNPSKSQPNRFLAFMIVPKGEKKLVIPLDDKAVPPPAAGENDELARLYREDQDDRKGGNIDWEKVGPRDKQRQARVLELYKADKLQTGADYYHAAMILQHGRTPDDYLLAHEFCVAAIGKGEDRAKWLAAASEDRFLQSVQRPQRFGTQFSVEASSGTWRVKPPVAPGVTDGLRRALNVPSLKEAEANAAKFQKLFQKAKKP
jgi:quercetin dioxygenase-like cupin family protein